MIKRAVRELAQRLFRSRSWKRGKQSTPSGLPARAGPEPADYIEKVLAWLLLNGTKVDDSPSQAIDLSDARRLLDRYTFINIQSGADVAEWPQGLRLSDTFLATARGGQAALSDHIVSHLDAATPASHPLDISYRSKTLIHAIEHGARPFLNPFTGQIDDARSSLGREWFFQDTADGAVLFSELGPAMSFMNLETIWVFPKWRTVLFVDNYFPLPEIRDHVAQCFLRLVRRREPVRRYLGTSERHVQISDFPSPHLSHYVWNVLTGWNHVVSFGDMRRVSGLVSYGGQGFFGTVRDLFDDLLPTTIRTATVRDDDDVLDHILATNGLLLTVKDEQIPHSLTRRAVVQSRAQCSTEFLAKLEEFRSRHRPLIVFTIRLDNRAWVEQEEGFVAFATKLKQRYPRLGIVLDGLSSDAVKGWTTEWMSLDAELKTAQDIEGGLGRAGIPVMRGVGQPFCEGVMLCEAVDAFVAPSGSGMALYKWISNKPGVAFSNRVVLSTEHNPLKVWDFFREGITPAFYVASDLITDGEPQRGDPARANFSMDWRDLHDAVIENLDTVLAAAADELA